jgi:dihydrofolate reductase
MSGRRIVLYVAASLDGRIARADGSLDWLSAFEGLDEDHGYATFIDTVDTVVMGRTTYEQVLTFGPYPYEGKRSLVFSTTRTRADKHATFVDGDVADLVAEWKAEPGSDIWLVGGSRLIASFLAARAIDDLIVSVIPVVLGGGIPLFAEGGPETWFDLVDAKPYATGLAQLTYRLRG